MVAGLLAWVRKMTQHASGFKAAFQDIATKRGVTASSLPSVARVM